MSLLTLEEAGNRILAGIPVLPAERVRFTDARGRVLAEDVIAAGDLPAWDNSAMDGFAVRSLDLRDASAEHPVELDIVGDLPAGRALAKALEAGQAIRIMTGAPVPAGADAVIMVERTQTDGSRVRISGVVRSGENIRRRGENVRAGETALRAGLPVRSSEVGLLASLGVTDVPVHRLPLVGVLSSGDELVPPEVTPGPGQIRDSNRFALAAHLNALGFPSRDFGTAPDAPEAIEELFRKAARECDVVVSSGGVSVGDYDLTKTVLARLGTMEFWRVAIRPGKPVAFGRIDGRPVFGLPGNPVSSLVVLDQLVRPALRRMAGHTTLHRRTFQAELEEPIHHAEGRTEFVRAKIRYESGRFLARKTGPQGSNLLKSLSLADGFVILPAETGHAAAGSLVDCQLLVEEI